MFYRRNNACGQPVVIFPVAKIMPYKIEYFLLSSQTTIIEFEDNAILEYRELRHPRIDIVSKLGESLVKLVTSLIKFAILYVDH